MRREDTAEAGGLPCRRPFGSPRSPPDPLGVGAAPRRTCGGPGLGALRGERGRRKARPPGAGGERPCRRQRGGDPAAARGRGARPGVRALGRGRRPGGLRLPGRLLPRAPGVQVSARRGRGRGGGPGAAPPPSPLLPLSPRTKHWSSSSASPPPKKKKKKKGGHRRSR